MRKIACLTIFLATAIASADGITIEPEAPKLDRGGVVLLTATTTGKSVVWVPMDAGLNVVKLPGAGDGKTLLLNAPASARAGAYRFLALTAVGEKPVYAELTVTVTTPEPLPIPPTPPVPPVPPPPPVVDDLAKRLKAAYDSEPNVAKRGQLVNLVAIYTAMGDHAEKDSAITSSRKLLEVLSSVKSGMLIDGVLMDLRRILSTETSAAIGAPNDLPLDRVAAATHFRRLVKSLPSVE